MVSVKWSNTEPVEAGEGHGVLLVLQATTPDKVLVRFHGRNVHGWQKRIGEDWREVRYLYRYNQKELEEWADSIQKLAQESRDVYLLFNNNSGGDAADNAKEMVNLLQIEYEGLAPRQLDLL